MSVWDVALAKGARVQLPSPDGWTTLVALLKGRARVNGAAADAASGGPSQIAVLSREGADFTLEAEEEARVLVLAGQPIDEPLVGYGPFVMNTREQIVQAIEDFNRGAFGRMS